jgi:phosphoglycolate phosphatase
VSAARLQAVLFDLDGTLVDSAPDLVGTLNDLRRDHQLDPLPYERLRHHASRGALGLLSAGLPELAEEVSTALRDEFIERYRARIWRDSHSFDGIEAVLDALASAGLRLGIVTNKIESLARPLVEQAGWGDRFGALIGGDSTARAKPDPSPVIEACRLRQVVPASCVMVGDDERDVRAGRSAGTGTVVALWGYISPSDQPRAWGADRMIERVEGLIELIDDPKLYKEVLP